MLKCVQRLLQHHASEPIILFSSAQARCQDRSRRDRSEPTPENARDPCIGPRTRRGLIQVKGVTLPRATLGTDPRFGAMRMWPRLPLSRRRSMLMLRRLLIASAAAIMLLVTFVPDDADARGRGGYRGGGGAYRGGAVAVRGPRGGGAVAVRGAGYRGGYRGYGYRGYGGAAAVGAAAVGAAAVGAAAAGAYGRCGYDAYGNWICY